MLLGQPVRQIAYCVENVREAAERHSRLFGSGPFFVVEDICTDVIHRGKPAKFRADSAFGQWGTMQVELFAQRDDAPSIITDLFPDPENRVGLHHLALIVDSLELAKQEMARAGFPVAMESTLPELDLTSVFVDTVSTYGHFIELYEPVPALTGFYEMVADAAKDFDGDRPLREIAF